MTGPEAHGSDAVTGPEIQVGGAVTGPEIQVGGAVTAPDMHVSGGVGGTYAHYEDIATLARASDDLAGALAEISLACHGALADPDVIASAVLDPAGAARFEAALLGALDGPGGLAALVAGFGQRAVALRAVAATYRASDAARAEAVDRIRWAAGFAFAETLPAGMTVLAGLGIPVVAYTAAGGEIDWERLITDHPGAVDTVVGASPGLLTGLSGLPVGDVPTGARLLGLLYPDGGHTVAAKGVDTGDPSMTTPPTGFGDLLSGLDHRNGEAYAGRPDQIDVRVITHPDGTRAYVVDIPGTKVWDPPGRFDEHLHDLGTNVHVMAGDVTARERAVADALHRAGAGATDPVLLIGHSQGGMVAAQAAHDTGTGAFGFNVTHVVTAGSPVGRCAVPDQVQMLSLENAYDVVPHLDAADNPDRPNRTTVAFDSQHGTVNDNHATGVSYLPAARALDHSTDPSVLAYRASAGAFLAGGPASTVRAEVYELTRTR